MSHGYFLVYCEAGAVSTLIKLSQRDATQANAEECMRLLDSLAELRDVLTNRDLSFVRTDIILQPFLDVIKSQATIDVVTSRALLSIDKFINAGLIPSDESASKAVESIAVAVTETKFAESNYDKADGVVYRMIESLHSLLRAQCGCFLKHEQICKMLHCLFRVCFDNDMIQLLRMSAETALADMTRILFSRLILFNSEDTLKSVHELLRFSVSLTNPLDTTNNEHMIVVGLNLVTVALETSIEYICNYSILLPIIKDELCKSLMQLLNSSKIYVFSMANRICYLLFMCDPLRPQLKFQMEAYFTSLMTIIGNELTQFDRKEIALESVVHLFRVPNLVSELYLNYDCGLYCTNLFEDLTKILSDNSFPTAGHILSTHLLSLDAILTVIGQICTHSVPTAPSKQHQTSAQQHDYPEIVVHSGQNNSKTKVTTTSSTRLPLISEVIAQKKQKKLISEGTELFNKKPKKGLEYLCENGILKSPLNSQEVANWLRENPHLDKMRIAECICDRSNPDILRAYVESFPIASTRLDEALRMFLESFRLPGEAAEISKIMQQFSDHWFEVNDKPFGHPDAAFTLSYAIIMLNTDQHNPQAQRNQQPMTVESFKKNLSGTNDKGDFDLDLLQQIYTSIKNNEIVLPAEQTGAVRENYVWKILKSRAESWEGTYLAASSGCNDRDLFNTIWGPATAALSYIFERSEEKTTLLKALSGYGNCATVAAYYGMTDVFDNLIIHLCKFSTLMGAFDLTDSSNNKPKDHQQGDTGYSSKSSTSENPDQAIYSFAQNYKAQISTQLMFQLIRKHGDNLRAGWKNVIDCVLQLFRMQALPTCLVMVEDFADVKGLVSIQRPKIKKSQSRQETAVLRWLGFGSAADLQPKIPTAEQEQMKKTVLTLISDSHPEEFLAGGKHLTSSALDELVASIVHWSFEICGDAASPQSDHHNHTAPAAVPTTSHLSDDQRSVTSATEIQSNPAIPNDSESLATATAAKLVLSDTRCVILSRQDEDELVFLLELLVSIAIDNKYRLPQIWLVVERHLRWILFGFGRNLFIVERAIVGVLRIVNKSLVHFHSNEQMAAKLLSALSMIGDLPPPALFFFSRQIASGLHQLVHQNAANVHSHEHWEILFTLMQGVGAAYYRNLDEEKVANPDEVHDENWEILSNLMQNVGDNYYKSLGMKQTSIDKPLPTTPQQQNSKTRSNSNPVLMWKHRNPQPQFNNNPMEFFDHESLSLAPLISKHDSDAFFRVCKTLAFLIQDAVHITPFNFDSCTECLRAMIEASLDGGTAAAMPTTNMATAAASSPASLAGSLSSSVENISRPESPTINVHATDDASSGFALLNEAENSADNLSPDGAEQSSPNPSLPSNQQPLPVLSRAARYEIASLQMVGLCTTMIQKCAVIQQQYGDGTDRSYSYMVLPIYSEAFRMRTIPLLQALARLCCDSRRKVRETAFVELQAICRQFPTQEMQLVDWEQYFGFVVFPLLRQLLAVNLTPSKEFYLVEELRCRVIQWAVRQILNHLDIISALPSFPILVVRLMLLMERYIQSAQSELPRETIPQALKNMIQVLDNSKIFDTQPLLGSEVRRLLQSFLPDLVKEIFAPPPPPRIPSPPVLPPNQVQAQPPIQPATDQLPVQAQNDQGQVPPPQPLENVPNNEVQQNQIPVQYAQPNQALEQQVNLPQEYGQGQMHPAHLQEQIQRQMQAAQYQMPGQAQQVVGAPLQFSNPLFGQIPSPVPFGQQQVPGQVVPQMPIQQQQYPVQDQTLPPPNA